MPSARLRATMLAIALLSWLPVPVAAAEDTFPAKPITIIVPFVAGGTLDFTARVIGDKLKDVVRQPVVIANKPGATNTIAAQALAAAPPDGHTLLISSGASFGHAHLLVPGFRMTLEDFIPIARVATNNSIFVVNAKVPVRTLSELIGYSQTKAGGLSFCTTGAGSQNHLQLEMLRALVKSKHPETPFAVTPVPYNGLVPALTALRRGDVDACVLPYAASVKDLDGKEVRIISVQASKRIPQIPHVATTGEQGYPEMDYNESPVIFSAIKGTNPETIRRIEAALRETMRDPTVVKRLDDADLQPGFVGTAQTTATVDSDVAKIIKVIKDANLDVAK